MSSLRPLRLPPRPLRETQAGTSSGKPIRQILRYKVSPGRIKHGALNFQSQQFCGDSKALDLPAEIRRGISGNRGEKRGAKSVGDVASNRIYQMQYQYVTAKIGFIFSFRNFVASLSFRPRKQSAIMKYPDSDVLKGI
jgi:hypothetical protein